MNFWGFTDDLVRRNEWKPPNEWTERPCAECGDPTFNAALCRDCDLEWIWASMGCRACGHVICNQEFAGPPEKQHAPMCPLVRSEDCFPRSHEEIKIQIDRMWHGERGLPWPDCLPPMFPEAA